MFFSQKINENIKQAFSTCETDIIYVALRPKMSQETKEMNRYIGFLSNAISLKLAQNSMFI